VGRERRLAWAVMATAEFFLGLSVLGRKRAQSKQKA
jgi:hypothetical protein